MRVCIVEPLRTVQQRQVERRAAILVTRVHVQLTLLRLLLRVLRRRDS